MRKAWIHCSIGFALSCSAFSALSADSYIYEYEDDSLHSERIPVAVDLQRDAASAREKGIPVMLEFSTRWCDYCRALEQQVLEPMLVSGDYTQRMLLRKLNVDDDDMVTWFDGRKINATRLGYKNGVELYPTLVIYNADGEEISERIIGITVLEFVAEKIDKALARAKREITSAPPGEID
jgi:thioredoxin-related protein